MACVAWAASGRSYGTATTDEHPEGLLVPDTATLACVVHRRWLKGQVTLCQANYRLIACARPSTPLGSMSGRNADSQRSRRS